MIKKTQKLKATLILLLLIIIVNYYVYHNKKHYIKNKKLVLVLAIFTLVTKLRIEVIFVILEL